MNESSDVGVIYLLWMSDGSFSTPSREDQPLVDRAMKLWADSRRDTWLTLTLENGTEFSVLASTITSTTRSTAEQRQRSTMRDKMVQDERREHRRQAGYIESETA